MTSFKQRWRRFGRFNLVGLMGAVLQMGLLWMLTKWLRLPALAAAPAAVELVMLHNFVWHESFTWRERRFRTIRQRAAALLWFHAGNGCVSLIGNTLLVYLLVERGGVAVLPAACLAIAGCSVLNFFIADRLVFSIRR